MDSQEKQTFNHKSNFIAGLLIILPITITIITSFWLLDLLTGFAVSAIGMTGLEGTVLGGILTIAMRVLILSGYIILIYTVGILARNGLAKKIIGCMNAAVMKLPGIRIIFETVRQISETLLSKEKNSFSEVVLIQYTGESKIVGFVTGETEWEDEAGNKLFSVFAPTCPNPTSGLLLYYPRHKMQTLDMSSAEAMKMIISAGMSPASDESNLKNKEENAPKEVKASQPQSRQS